MGKKSPKKPAPIEGTEDLPLWQIKMGFAGGIDAQTGEVILEDDQLISKERLEEMAWADLAKFGQVRPYDGTPPVVPAFWRQRGNDRRPQTTSPQPKQLPPPPPRGSGGVATSHVGVGQVAAPIDGPPNDSDWQVYRPTSRRKSRAAGSPSSGEAAKAGSTQRDTG